tara:strand:+ start:72 stop:566 length:495 start_codon:yes stop_codon:yes gene_type:complete
MGGGGRTVVQEITKPVQTYQDQWIKDRFATGQQRYDELADWMNQRKTALANPTMYNVGDGQSVTRDQLGGYFQGQLADQKKMFDAQIAEIKKQRDLDEETNKKRTDVYQARLGDISGMLGANRASLQMQGEQLARAGIRDRVRSYSGTGGGFNRAGLRIKTLNI